MGLGGITGTKNGTFWGVTGSYWGTAGIGGNWWELGTKSGLGGNQWELLVGIIGLGVNQLELVGMKVVQIPGFRKINQYFEILFLANMYFIGDDDH